MENNSNKVNEIGNKLKDYIKKIFNQMKFGCTRNYCYNIYCAKGNDFTDFSEKDIVFHALRLSKENNPENYFCLSNKFPEVENFIFKINHNPIKHEKFDIFGPHKKFNLIIEFEKVRKYFDKSRDILNELILLNKYFKEFIEEEHSDISKLNWIYYIYSLYMIYICSNHNFCYIQTYAEEFNNFFKNFIYFKNKIINSLDIYKEFNKDLLQIIVNNFQNFLTLLLFHLGESEIRDDESLQVLVSFMKIFKFFYEVNEKFNIINYKEFYNESVNKNLNIKEECKIYFKMLKKKENDEFSILKYHWLFDPAAKSDILRIFNFGKQRYELFNSISDIMNDLNMINIGNLYLMMEIRRDNMIEEALNFISNPELNFKKQLRIKFYGEQGVDEGGVKKEFFMLLIRQLFDTSYGMFTYNEENRFFWINQFSYEPKIKFELIGVLLGLALFNSVILDIKFPLVIYKKLLNHKTNLEDMKEIDLELYNNFKYLLSTKEKDLKDKLSTTFVAISDHFGEKVIYPLKENGENILVDEHNREEFVDLYLNWYFDKSIENFFTPFKKGFYRVCDDDLFYMLKPDELELIICGTQNLDFFELEKAARYEDGYDKDSITIKFLWEVVHCLSEEEKKKFLFFLTGCDRAPINGLGSLIITISRFGPDSDKLPCAHTCFNHLLLPDYLDKEKLKNRLIIAINNSEGFGLM